MPSCKTRSQKKQKVQKQRGGNGADDWRKFVMKFLDHIERRTRKERKTIVNEKETSFIATFKRKIGETD